MYMCRLWINDLQELNLGHSQENESQRWLLAAPDAKLTLRNYIVTMLHMPVC